MSRRIPRLEVIEAFIEAARAPSFRIAAERCALSPAAFSRRIQTFAGFVGREAFERRPEGMRLTSFGRECLETLEPAYRAMTQAALELEAEPAVQTVSLSLSHSLAVGWLIPRMERFAERHPGLKVDIVTTRTAEAVRAGAADLGLCASDVEVAGMHVEHLLDINVAPVACPRIAGVFLAGAGRVEAHRLLTVDQHPDLWEWWARAAGVSGAELKAAQSFDMAQALYEAAAAGHGLAPGMDVMVGPHLKSGRLVDLGLPSVRYPGGYRLVARPSRLRLPKVAALRAWLMDEARGDRDHAAALPVVPSVAA